MRKLTEKKLVLASHNSGKLIEISHLLAPYKIDILSAASLDIPEPEETENTFEGNARLKALHSASLSGLPALADDSGLVVPALGGQPGIYSARWAGPTKDFSIAIKRIEQELPNKEDNAAYFVCSLALAWPDKHVEIFTGKWNGYLSFPPKGEHGFGYDPIFIPEGYTLTAAEMLPEQKYSLSHRTKAFQKLIKNCLL